MFRLWSLSLTASEVVQAGYRAIEAIKPKPMPPRHAADKGDVARTILGTLREAKRPCSTQELTVHVMAERRMNTADKRLVRTVEKRVGQALRHHRNKGSG